MRIIAVMNQKGGVGKTTTAVSLAAALGERGRRVLVVDLDPQGSASAWLGQAEDSGQALLEALTEEEPLAELVEGTSAEGVEVIASGPQLAKAERALAGDPAAVAILRDLLQDLPAGRWDYVLLDTPPTVGSLSSAALLAAREVLIPVEASSMAVAGLGTMLDTVKRVRRLNEDLQVLGILVCRVDARTRLGRDLPELLEQKFPEMVLQTQIRESVRCREAWAHREPITTYDPQGAAAEDYRAAAAEIEGRTP